MSRTAKIHRATNETIIDLSINLDGTGEREIRTGIGFFDHMLDHLAKHSMIDFYLTTQGDLHIDAHHTVEDVGICFGKLLSEALGNKQGIRRYGSVTIPMDECLVTAAVDLSGRPFLGWNVEMPQEMLGSFSSQLAEEFWKSVSFFGLFNLHILLHYGRNTHHIIECIFKAVAQALRQAIELDPHRTTIPSTKGSL